MRSEKSGGWCRVARAGATRMRRPPALKPPWRLVPLCRIRVSLWACQTKRSTGAEELRMRRVSAGKPSMIQDRPVGGKATPPVQRWQIGEKAMSRSKRRGRFHTSGSSPRIVGLAWHRGQHNGFLDGDQDSVDRPGKGPADVFGRGESQLLTDAEAAVLASNPRSLAAQIAPWAMFLAALPRSAPSLAVSRMTLRSVVRDTVLRASGAP